MDPADAPRPVVMAAVAGAHGVGGDVRLKLFCESIESFRAHGRFDAGGVPLTLMAVRPGPQGAIARFAEVADRTAAERLRGTLLTVSRASLPPLPPGEYYWHDLIGRPVVDEAGEAAGAVVGIENYGASDILEIERPDGRRVLVPLVPAAVPEVGARIVALRAFLDA